LPHYLAFHKKGTHLFQLVPSLLQFEMLSNLRVLQRKLLDLVAVQVVQDAGVDLARELMSAQLPTPTAYLVEELLEQLNVDKHCARVRELLGDNGEEDLRAERGLLRTRLAAFRADRMLASLEEGEPVLE
jgi:hypothetical protein